MRWVVFAVPLVAALGCEGAKPAPKPTEATKALPPAPKASAAKTVEWSAVASAAKKRAAVISGYGEAESLSAQAAISARSAQRLGGMTDNERTDHLDALKRVKEIGIDRADEQSLKRAERFAPITIELMRIGTVQSKADRTAVASVGAKFAGFPLRGDSGYTDEQLRQIPDARLIKIGVNMAIFKKAVPPLASDYALLHEVGLNQLAFGNAVAAGLQGGAASVPQWYLNRVQAGLADSVEREADLLVRLWAVSALLPTAEREVFVKRVAIAAAKPDFGAAQIVAAATGK